ncbi:chorismate transformation enzyme, FkbO/Hyg5 family [Luteimonas sp. A277]
MLNQQVQSARDAQQETGGHGARLRVDYVYGQAADALLAEPGVLAVFGFGSQAPHSDDPRYLRIPLEPWGEAPLEVWRTDAPVRYGRDGEIAWATDGRLSFGVIEVDEAGIGINEAARRGYQTLGSHLQAGATPHMLRIWNYLDAITLGDGDDERYRQFCLGRADGMGSFDPDRLPAATGIGRCDDTRILQMYWLSAAEPGTPVENPRQINAYCYPRQYGPQPPSFARAMLPAAGADIPLLLSGTAAIVGHASQHEGELLAQLEETFANFDALLASARRGRPELPARFGAGTRLKVYVRDREDLPVVARALDERFGDRVPHIVLHAVICRRELIVEIDGVHG